MQQSIQKPAALATDAAQAHGVQFGGAGLRREEPPSGWVGCDARLYAGCARLCVVLKFRRPAESTRKHEVGVIVWVAVIGVVPRKELCWVNKGPRRLHRAMSG